MATMNFFITFSPFLGFNAHQPARLINQASLRGPPQRNGADLYQGTINIASSTKAGAADYPPSRTGSTP
jgi:hypothetical protein